MANAASRPQPRESGSVARLKLAEVTGRVHQLAGIIDVAEPDDVAQFVQDRCPNLPVAVLRGELWSIQEHDAGHVDLWVAMPSIQTNASADPSHLAVKTWHLGWIRPGDEDRRPTVAVTRAL